jgi:hypothetical protein
MFGFISTV